MHAARLVALQLAAESVRERAAAVLGRSEYQRELPHESQHFQLELPRVNFLKTLLVLLGWTGLAILAVLLVVWLARRVGWRRDEMMAPANPARSAPVEIQIVGAEAFASEGRYGDAIHALLLETLTALAGAARLPAAFTSREVLERVPLGAEAREALAALVSAVEVSWFGSTVPGEPDYRICLNCYHVFLASYRSAA